MTETVPVAPAQRRLISINELIEFKDYDKAMLSVHGRQSGEELESYSYSEWLEVFKGQTVEEAFEKGFKI